MPCRRSSVDRVAAGFARPIGDGDDADRLAVAAPRAPASDRARSSSSSRRCRSPASTGPLLEQPMVAEHDVRTVHRPSRRGPAAHDTSCAGRATTPAACGVLEQSPARSDARSAARPTAASATIAAGGDAVERHHVDDFRRTARQRAGLVERDAADAAGPLEVRAALDQHALPRRAGQRGDDRHRRRDDERARARHDEQHQRAVDPRLPRRRQASGGTTATSDRQDDDRRRVDAREALDERLRGRALRLRLLDEMDDARQRRVAAEPRDADVERAAAVDAAGEHLVARRLVHRQRLAGDRRLVDGARARRRPRRRAGPSRRA